MTALRSHFNSQKPDQRLCCQNGLEKYTYYWKIAAEKEAPVGSKQPWGCFCTAYQIRLRKRDIFSSKNTVTVFNILFENLRPSVL